MRSLTVTDRFRGCLLGLAAGDALGTTVEFKRRGTFTPLTDMVGGGPFRLAPGMWTDDTSMAMCIASSLVETRAFNLRDQMDRYCRWWQDGYWSSTGRCFDIGTTTGTALRRYLEAGDPRAGSADPQTAANGCIMRLAPVPMFFFPDERAAGQFSAESARTTHGAAECLDACRLFGAMICRALSDASKEDVLMRDAQNTFDSAKIAAIARGEYRGKAEREIRGTGYVVESLEAALWCFDQTATYEAAVLRAANLGDDADTTAAVCGQLAGAFYGVDAIPEGWREKLARREEIEVIADALHNTSHAEP